jgi:chorismate synthase
MNTIGRNVKITCSGESHSDFLTLSIVGLPIGLAIDEIGIRQALSKRRPKGELTTARIEADHYTISGGITDGLTDGTPVIFVIPNENIRSGDYENVLLVPRPGHADYPAYVKYPEHQIKTGGGMFSGRLTVMYVIAGAIAKQILNQKGIYAGSHISRVAEVKDDAFDPISVPFDLIAKLESADFPLINDWRESGMKEAVSLAKSANDSIGGIVESAVIGLPVGLGEPLFDSIESTLSHLLFSIPAIKGVEFGDGFSYVKSPGSAVSDGYYYSDKSEVLTYANHNGGILGGMATGMPVIVRCVVKPTSSIGIPQQSIHLESKTNVSLTVAGRHDPCIVLRAVHVINAMLYLGILDLMMEPEFMKADE